MHRHILRFTLWLLAAACVLAGRAYNDDHRWHYYYSYRSPQQVLAFGSEVLVCCNGNLLAYDKSDQAVRTIDKFTGLHDKQIKHMTYAPDVQTAVLLYANNNIDLLRPDGEVVNMPQLKQYVDADITVQRLSASGKWALLSCTSGLVLIDLEAAAVRAFYPLGVSVTDATVLGQRIVMAAGGVLYSGRLTDNLYQLSSWQQHGTLPVQFMLALNARQAYLAVDASDPTYGGLTLLTLDEGAAAPVVQRVTSSTATSGQRSQRGIAFTSGPSVITLSPDAPTTLHTAKAEHTLRSAVLAADGSLWSINSRYEVLNATLGADGDALTPSGHSVQPFGPLNDLTYSLQWHHGNLYVCGGQPDYTDHARLTGTVMRYDGSEWHAVQPADVTAAVGENFVNAVQVAVHPTETNRYYVSTYGVGLMEFADEKYVRHYNDKNAPLYTPLRGTSASSRYVRLDALAFDENGYLWVTNAHADSVLVLLSPQGTWHKLCPTSVAHTTNVCAIRFDGKGRAWMGLTYETKVPSGLLVYDYNGTSANDKDDSEVFRASATNEDGTTCSIAEVKDLRFDHNGWLWLACSGGIFALSDPEAWLRGNYTVYQPKVPRNDGTNYADYLLDGVRCNALAIDGGNRKWIGTAGSGIYLASADGTEVIAHFTAANSPLPSDNIYALAYDEASGNLMIATDYGLCSYDTQVTEPSDALSSSQLKVYPNPVRPDYQGHVVVSGLTEGAEVKVMGTGGTLVARGRATGGSFSWDVCGPTGGRVASGVYYILVATHDGKKSVSTKVIVI